MSFKIAYDAGHSLVTPGKRTPEGEHEWAFSNKVVLAFEKELKTYKDVELLRVDDRTGKTDVSLRTRTNKANKWCADIYISFHQNANTGKWGSWTGTETFYSLGSIKGKQLAELIQGAALKAFELRDRGLKTNNLHITRETNMPAVLVEGAFMDSTIDIKKLRDDNVLENAGKYIAQAVAKYAELKKDNVLVDRSENKTEKIEVKTKPSTSSKPKANLKIDGYWGKATTTALQKYFGTSQDGVISGQYCNSITQAIPSVEFVKNGKYTGSNVIRELQKLIGATVDGYIGKDTILKLQKHFGTVQDGKLSKPSLVVKELQRRLNNGKL